VVKEKQEKALAEHVARHPEDVGRTVKDFKWILHEIVKWRREAANVRACRLAGAISRLSATYQQGLLTLQRKRTGGNQHVTVKHIHQQVNVTEGGQAVVAGETVTRGQGERRWGMIENEQ
jgi:hypothetical protein